MKKQWEKLNLNNFPEQEVMIFCVYCQTKNRNDEGWVYSTDHNKLAEIIVRQRNEQLGSKKLLLELVGRCKLGERLYLCDRCCK